MQAPKGGLDCIPIRILRLAFANASNSDRRFHPDHIYLSVRRSANMPRLFSCHARPLLPQASSANPIVYHQIYSLAVFEWGGQEGPTHIESGLTSFVAAEHDCFGLGLVKACYEIVPVLGPYLP